MYEFIFPAIACHAFLLRWMVHGWPLLYSTHQCYFGTWYMVRTWMVHGRPLLYSTQCYSCIWFENGWYMAGPFCTVHTSESLVHGWYMDGKMYHWYMVGPSCTVHSTILVHLCMSPILVHGAIVVLPYIDQPDQHTSSLDCSSQIYIHK